MKKEIEDSGRISTNWLHWIEPWYFVYTLLGIAAAGVIPVLLPLVVGQSGAATEVGMVMAAVSLGGLSSPLWGILTDRYRVHRLVLTTGLFLTAAGLAAFAFTTQPFIWFILALLASIGIAGSSTVANLFVVEAHPKEEWDERIGWLQTFYGLGQVIGLLLVGILSTINLRIGLLATAGLAGLAILLGWLMTKSLSLQSVANPIFAHPARHAEGTIHSPQRSFHLMNLKDITKLGKVFRSRFGLFLVVWLLAFAGAAAVFSQYPLLMEKAFHIAPAISSTAFAVMAGLGLMLYTPSGQWSERFGATTILRGSMVIRLLAFVILFTLGLIRLSSSAWLALLAFAFVVLAWSLMSVSGTDLAATLSTAGEGEGLGIFNAITALAGVIGAILGGWVAGIWGYNATPIVAVVGLALSLLLSAMLKREDS